MRNTPCRLELVFGGRAEPDIGPAVAPVGRKRVRDVLRALGTELPVERGGGADQSPEVGPPSLGCSVVEDVGHAGAKHPMPHAGDQGVAVPEERLPPVVGRGAHACGVRVPEVAALAVAAPGAPGYRRGVAVVAGRADAQAAEPRVEGGMGPGDRGRAHGRRADLIRPYSLCGIVNI